MQAKLMQRNIQWKNPQAIYFRLVQLLILQGIKRTAPLQVKENSNAYKVQH